MPKYRQTKKDPNARKAAAAKRKLEARIRRELAAEVKRLERQNKNGKK